MQDSLRTPFAFDVAEGKVHYLGRWHFSGFEAIKTFLPDAIARYKAQKTILKKPIKHEIDLSIAVIDSMASDRLIFEENYPTHGVKKTESTLPLHPFRQEKHVFTLLIQPLNPSGFWFQNHQHMHQQMPRPEIPRF